ncbi:apicoplast ribosomal protein S15 precursor, putative [Plasmodium malariae]|uniref:Apicoplast ribosomal protein S15, putative n=1 Tax=Plasmodium malariae TaxID=5858 RepID=A0A1C3KC62_PLAMA|nr:apicoplast ribosomal protein S15 precursor, putative [Plasmodium malariae]
MKKIKSCSALTLFFHLQLLSIILFTNGFYIDDKINCCSKHKAPSIFPNKKILNRNIILKANNDHEKFTNKLPNTNNEHIDDNMQENFVGTGTKGRTEKMRSEIDKILKKGENITMERSFSFSKNDITIKPDLLKDLITQKYRKIFQRHEKDCGSSEIQIIILTFKIYFLTEHMKKNKKDFACLRGLFKCVSKRRRLLVYLGQKDREMFNKITDFFNIKKPLIPRTAEYYSKDLKYIHFNNTKRFKNNAEKKKKDKLKKKNVQTDKILFSM